MSPGGRQLNGIPSVGVEEPVPLGAAGSPKPTQPLHQSPHMNGLCKSSVKLGHSKPLALVPASPLDGALAETLWGTMEISKQ